MGHDGPGHLAIAEGKTRGPATFRSITAKWGSGLSVEMSVKHGPVTLLIRRPNRGTAGSTLLVAEAESVPGPILEIGNTNSRYRFSVGARKFVND